jgi:hypothetical protein
MCHQLQRETGVEVVKRATDCEKRRCLVTGHQEVQDEVVGSRRVHLYSLVEEDGNAVVVARQGKRY